MIRSSSSSPPLIQDGLNEVLLTLSSGSWVSKGRYREWNFYWLLITWGRLTNVHDQMNPKMRFQLQQYRILLRQIYHHEWPEFYHWEVFGYLKLLISILLGLQNQVDDKLWINRSLFKLEVQAVDPKPITNLIRLWSIRKLRIRTLTNPKYQAWEVGIVKWGVISSLEFRYCLNSTIVTTEHIQGKFRFSLDQAQMVTLWDLL